MEKIASLRFYDYPALSESMDNWWSGLARAFADQGIKGVPSRLCRDGHPNDTLRSPRLLFGQTCGYPLVSELKDHVIPVITPEYDTPDTDGPMYRSLILARNDMGVTEMADLEGTTVAINSLRSFSGFIALKTAFLQFLSDRPFFGSVVETRSHLGSLKAISQGDADVCACDCVSFHLIARLHPDLARGFAVIGYGPRAPGLPFVTHHLQSDDAVERLKQGVLQAIDDPSLKEVRSRLLLNGASVLSTGDYAVIDELVQQLDKKNADALFPDNHLSFSERWA